MLDILSTILGGYGAGIRAGTPGPLDDYWYTPITGGRVKAGVDVNHDTALTCSAFFNGVELLANAMKTLPVFVYRRDADGGKTPDRTHAVYRLLHDKPNPETRAGAFKYYMELCRILWGNGYAVIERNRDGTPVALWQVHPSRVRPLRGESDQLFYEIRELSGETYLLDAADMFHYFGPTKDGIMGISVLDQAREALGLPMASERYASTFFGNGARPGGILKLPADISDERRKALSEQIRATYGGPDNAHKTMIGEEGWAFEAVGMQHDHAQLIETMEHGTVIVAQFLGIAPHKLMDLRRATFSNIEHLDIEHVRVAIMPRATDWRDEIAAKLFTPAENEAGYFAEFQLLALMQGDSKSRAEYYRTMRQLGAMTLNEIRGRENLNPLPARIGDAVFVQSNEVMFTPDGEIVNLASLASNEAESDDDDEPPPTEEPEDDDDEEPEPEPEERTDARDLEAVKLAVMPVLTHAAERLARKENMARGRAAKRCTGDPAAWSEWCSTFYVEHRQAAVAEFGPGVQTLTTLLGHLFDERSLRAWVDSVYSVDSRIPHKPELAADVATMLIEEVTACIPT